MTLADTRANQPALNELTALVAEKSMDTLISQIEAVLAHRETLLVLDEDANRLRQQFFESPSPLDKFSAYWDKRSWWSKFTTHLGLVAVAIASALLLHFFVLPLLAVAIFVTTTQILSSHYQAIKARFERVQAHCQQVEGDIVVNKERLAALAQALQELNHAVVDENQVIKQHNEELQIEISQMNEALEDLSVAASSAKDSVLHIEAAGQQWVEKMTDGCSVLDDLNQIATTEILRLADITGDLSQTNIKVGRSVEALAEVVESLQARLAAAFEPSAIADVKAVPMSALTETLLVGSAQQNAQIRAGEQAAELAARRYATLFARVNVQIGACTEPTFSEQPAPKMTMV